MIDGRLFLDSRSYYVCERCGASHELHRGQWGSHVRKRAASTGSSYLVHLFFLRSRCAQPRAPDVITKK
jgi:hypothetical protein